MRERSSSSRRGMAERVAYRPVGDPLRRGCGLYRAPTGVVPHQQGVDFTVHRPESPSRGVDFTGDSTGAPLFIGCGLYRAPPGVALPSHVDFAVILLGVARWLCVDFTVARRGLYRDWHFLKSC
jgi:hypothetical protein